MCDQMKIKLSCILLFFYIHVKPINLSNFHNTTKVGLFHLENTMIWKFENYNLIKMVFYRFIYKKIEN
jgi:hypothetical protein